MSGYKQLLSFFLLLSLFSGCAGQIDQANQQLQVNELHQLATRYREMRLQAGPNPRGEAAKWGSEYYLTMNQLGEWLGNPTYSNTEVITLMGQPDVGPTDCADDTYDIMFGYYWRGPHDILWFMSNADMVQDYRWFHAYE